MAVTQSTTPLAQHPGYRRMFAPGKLTLGVFFPIEAFDRDRPMMQNQVELAKRAEATGFAALWFRDVPLRDPNFGDVGQIYDPWVYLGYITAHTQNIALATGSIILPLRHPIHTAKAAASVDQLSNGRLVLGIASGDRPVEFPAFGRDLENRGESFREHLRYFDTLLSEEFPRIDNEFGNMRGYVDLIPKAWNQRIPRLVTGHSQQDMAWIAANSDGWITYPRTLSRQIELVANWRRLTEEAAPGVFKPFAQSLYIDLAAEPDELPQPIHLGFRLGRNHLIGFLEQSQSHGVNHIVLNLKYGRRPAPEVLEELAEYVVPSFPHQDTGASE